MALSWIHPAQSSPRSEKLLSEVETGALIIVPCLWHFEIANILLVLQRRGKINSLERKRAVDLLSGMNFTVDEMPGNSVFEATSALAEKHGLSIYDAAYLELAIRRRLQLASRDDTLNAAASKYGLAEI